MRGGAGGEGREAAEVAESVPLRSVLTSDCREVLEMFPCSYRRWWRGFEATIGCTVNVNGAPGWQKGVLAQVPVEQEGMGCGLWIAYCSQAF